MLRKSDINIKITLTTNSFNGEIENSLRFGKQEH